MTTIPADLLQAISQPGGGQVALVIGAGCSVEAPTSVPLAGPLSRETERRLVADGILAAGQCQNPDDLPALASLVWQLTESQDALVTRFPRDDMRLARPNRGYFTLIALMAERAITHVLSLNFDCAVQNAASGLGHKIKIIATPGEAVPLSATLVHLHGNAYSDPDAWILRTEVMDDAWKGQWHQVVANQILSAPTILFAGLGSAAPVLSESISLIQDALAGNKTLYQVDFGPFAANTLAQQLAIPQAHYIQGGWSDTICRLGDRVVADQVHALTINGDAVLAANQFSQADRDRFATHAAKLANLPLLGLGKLRAFAKLEKRTYYLPHAEDHDQRIAEPIVKLAELCEQLGLQAEPTSGGTWHLSRDGRKIGQLILASGGGTLRLTAIEPAATALCDALRDDIGTAPDLVLAGGLMPGNAPSGQIDLIAGYDCQDIIDGPAAPPIISANDPDLVERIGTLLNVA